MLPPLSTHFGSVLVFGFTPPVQVAVPVCCAALFRTSFFPAPIPFEHGLQKSSPLPTTKQLIGVDYFWGVLFFFRCSGMQFSCCLA